MNDILEGAELDPESAPAPVGILGVDPAGGPDRSVKVEPGALGALPDAVKRAAERARRRAPLEPLRLCPRCSASSSCRSPRRPSARSSVAQQKCLGLTNTGSMS